MSSTKTSNFGYPGSVTDVSQFTFMVDKVLEYGYKKIGFILERDYFSKENICYIDNNGYSFIIMCKGCKALVYSLILEKCGMFETKREATIRAYKVYGVTTTAKRDFVIPIKKVSTTIFTCKRDKKWKLWCFLFYKNLVVSILV